MKPFTKVVAFSLLMSLVVAIPSSRAEWIARDLSVCTASGTQNAPAIATDKLGNTFVAWEDYRDYVRTVGNSIRVQKLDPSGAPLWTIDGADVTSTSRHKGGLRLVPDDLGGVYVAFASDSETTTMCYEDWMSRIMLSRVDAGGSALWCKRVSNAQANMFNEEELNLLPDGAGGVIVVWMRQTGFFSYDCASPVGLCCIWTAQSIRAQRVDMEGNRPWGLDGVTVPTLTSAPAQISAARADSTSVILVWFEATGQYSFFTDICAQKLGMDGTLRWTGTRDTVTVSQSWLPVTSDGAGGVVVAWKDVRNGVNAPAVYVQRFNEAGNTVWTVGGVQLSSLGSYFGEIGIRRSDPDAWIVHWRDGTRDGTAPRAQKIDGDGNVLWTSGGVAVSTESNVTANGLHAVPDGEGGAVFAWERIAPPPREPQLMAIWGASSTDIFTVGECGSTYRFDGAAWTKMETGTSSKLLGVWGSAGDDVFAVGAAGTILHYDGLAWSMMTSGTTEELRGIWGSSPNDVFAVGGHGTILHYDGTAWSLMNYSLGGEINAVYGTSNTNVYAVGNYQANYIYKGMTLHYDGVAWTRTMKLNCFYYSIWVSPGGEIFIGGFYYATGAAVFHDSGSGLETTLLDTYDSVRGAWGSSASDVYMVLDEGSLAHWDGSAWNMSAISTSRLSSVWGAGAGDVWVAGDMTMLRHLEGGSWVTRSHQDYDIYAQRLDATGARLWLDEGAPVTVSMDDQSKMALASDPNGSPILAWSDGRNGNWDILSRKILIQRGPTVETELLAFSAEPAGTGVRIAWELSRFDEGATFNVARTAGPEQGAWSLILPKIERNGLGFSFDDLGLAPGTGYRYRVDVSDTKGVRLLFETDTVSMPAPPLTLYQNFPNPFNPMTTIHYSLPEKCRVALRIYDVSGRLVARLVDTEQPAGSHRVEWNGKDTQGKQASSGVYFYRLTAGKKTISKTMVLLR